MASFNLTIEDCSPLVTYLPAGAWQDSPSDDPHLEASWKRFTDRADLPLTPFKSYSSANFHRASANGATASIDFHGSGITFLGARRPGYGRFTLTVDGQTVVANGDASSTEIRAREILATVNGLSPGNHRAVLTKLDEGQIDIDSVTILDQLGSVGSQIQIQNFDDISPSLTYLPSPASWKTNERDIFQDNTLHFSEAPDAAVSMTFSGDAVALYGTMSPDRTATKVTLNGEQFVLGGGANGHASRLHTKVLLFFRNGLGPGQHTFTYAAESPNAQAPFIDIDAIAVLSTAQGPDAGGSTPTETSFTGVITPSSTPGLDSSNGGLTGDGNTAPSSTGPSKGVIIGAAIGGAIGLLALIGLCFLVFWYRKRRMQDAEDNIRSPLSPVLPMQQERIHGVTISGPMELSGPRENSVFVFPPPPKPKSPIMDRFRHSIAPSYYGSALSGRSSMGSTSASTSPLVRFEMPPVPSPKPLPRIPMSPPSQMNYYEGFSSPSLSERSLRPSPRIRTRADFTDYSQRRI